MDAKKTKRKGGWPKRDRAALSVRVSPALARELTRLARRYGLTRNQFIGTVLEAVVMIERQGKPGTVPAMSLLPELIDQMLEMAASRLRE